MTKMFDPTIYSLQPLVTTPVTIPLQTTTTTSASSNDTPLNIGDHDPSPSSDGHSGSSSLKDIVVVGDAEQKAMRDYQMDGNYEELDTVSRKTSTTSDYTSLSDYTPENTVTRESSVTTSTLRNDFPADECIEGRDALTTGESARNDDSCVIEMSDKLVSGVEETISPLPNDNVRSPDVEVPTTQRARKISRFLVTPSVVSIDCDNERIVDEIQQVKTEGIYDGQLNTIQQQVYNEDGTVFSVQQMAQFEASQQQITYSQPPGFGFSGDMIDANNLINNQTIEQYNAAMPNKPLGPESINTLEQLKIGLENITHAHVQPKPKDAQPTVSEVKSTGQMNEEQTSNSVESPMSYADVAAGGTVQIMNEITGQQFEPVSDVYLQQQPIVQSPQVMASSPQTNIGSMPSTSDQIPTSTSENLSQTTSVYNSRRTSAEFVAMEQCSKTQSDTITLDNVESAENSRKLSQQGSVDKPEM